MNTMVVFFFFLVNVTLAFDFIRDSLSLIDQKSDPCNDFFRHACPAGRYELISKSVYEKLETEFFNNQPPRAWDNLKSLKALDALRVGELPTNLTDYYVKLFELQCWNSIDTTPVLQKIESIMNGTTTPNCRLHTCVSSLAADTNCTRATSFLTERLESIFDVKRTKEFVEDVKFKTKIVMWNIKGVSLILGEDVKNGISIINTFVTDMIDLAGEMIAETPWLKTYNLEGRTEDLVSKMRLYENYGEALEKNLDTIMKFEILYSDCIHEVGDYGELLCLVFASSALARVRVADLKFFNFFNAMNRHPFVHFGYNFYHVANNSAMPAKIGYSGFVAGHELSHTLIEDPNETMLFPLFSEPAIQCVQDQYRATCKEYKEAVCDVEDRQIDDNGADILGSQLAYRLLEEYMGEQLKDEYLQLNDISITNQQLFFYAAAFSFCQGTPSGFENDSHAAGNARINALAQLPGFQEAFKCSNDSRIMKTVEKQCFIFGKDAPAQRR